MTDMVEKVARELAGHVQGLPWDELPEHRKAVTPRAEWGKLCFRDMARAAIRALMEPTEEMLKAREGLYDFPPDQEDREDWQAMLKAALDEPECPMCDECGKYPADPPSKLCPGCQAYREHTAI